MTTPYARITENKVKTYFIFFLFILIFTGFFLVIGNYYGSPLPYAVMGFGISLASTFGSYFFSDKMVLAQTKAKPAKKEEYFDLYTVTENLAIADGLPMPKVYVVDDPSPNAFATGRNPKHGVVCATTGLLSILDRSELEGVIAHELSHIKNYDILVSSIAAVLVGTLALVADIAMRSFWWGGNRDNDNSSSRNPIMLVIMLVAMIVTPIVATLIQLAVSRQREYLADASGALLTRYPEALASALQKISSYPVGVSSATTSTAHLFISNPFKQNASKMAGMMQQLFSTHPPAEKRIEILRKM